MKMVGTIIGAINKPRSTPETFDWVTCSEYAAAVPKVVASTITSDAVISETWVALRHSSEAKYLKNGSMLNDLGGKLR